MPEWTPEHLVDAGLAPQLPLRVPAVDLTHDARCALGRPLGEFLRRLHVDAELRLTTA